MDDRWIKCQKVDWMMDGQMVECQKGGWMDKMLERQNRKMDGQNTRKIEQTNFAWMDEAVEREMKRWMEHQKDEGWMDG